MRRPTSQGNGHLSPRLLIGLLTLVILTTSGVAFLFITLLS